MFHLIGLAIPIILKSCVIEVDSAMKSLTPSRHDPTCTLYMEHHWILYMAASASVFRLTAHYTQIFHTPPVIVTPYEPQEFTDTHSQKKEWWQKLEDIRLTAHYTQIFHTPPVIVTPYELQEFTDTHSQKKEWWQKLEDIPHP